MASMAIPKCAFPVLKQVRVHWEWEFQKQKEWRGQKIIKRKKEMFMF